MLNPFAPVETQTAFRLGQNDQILMFQKAGSMMCRAHAIQSTRRARHKPTKANPE